MIGLPDFFESRRVTLLRHPPSAASNVVDSVENPVVKIENGQRHIEKTGETDPYNKNFGLLERASSQYHSLKESLMRANSKDFFFEKYPL